MKFYRRGAIRFVKIGRFGFSWWWAKRKPTTWQERYQTYGDMEGIVNDRGI
jgi:hypothetical protein